MHISLSHVFTVDVEYGYPSIIRPPIIVAGCQYLKLPTEIKGYDVDTRQSGHSVREVATLGSLDLVKFVAWVSHSNYLKVHYRSC